MQEHIIFKWLSTKSTIEYLGEWESLYNPDFNYTEFGTIKNMAGSNNFVLSTKQWILSTNQLPYPYGRNQAKLDSRNAFEAADEHGLCKRGRRFECRPVWLYREGMARCPCRLAGECPRLCDGEPADLPFEYGIAEFRID